MNRRKKGNQILKARAKKAKAKLSPNKKRRYISKAERARIETGGKAVPSLSGQGQNEGSPAV